MTKHKVFSYACAAIHIRMKVGVCHTIELVQFLDAQRVVARATGGSREGKKTFKPSHGNPAPKEGRIPEKHFLNEDMTFLSYCQG